MVGVGTIFGTEATLTGLPMTWESMTAFRISEQEALNQFAYNKLQSGTIT